MLAYLTVSGTLGAALATGHEARWRDVTRLMLLGEALTAWGGIMLQTPLEARRPRDVALLRRRLARATP